MKRIIFLLIISIFCQQSLVQAITLETVMVVKSIKTKMPVPVQVQKENEQQKRKSVHLARRIPNGNAEIQGVGGSGPNLLPPGYSMATTHKDLVRLLRCSLDRLKDESAVGNQHITELHKLLENQKIRLAFTPSILPTKGWLSSSFGYRNSPFTGVKEFHKGIDIATKMSTPVVAPANGIVSSIRWEHMSGKVLYISHGYSLVTKYAHLQKVLVRKDQLVNRGETVALVGNTGRSTGPHLHYEVHLNGVPMNPLRYVSRDALPFLTDRPTTEPATSTLPPMSLHMTTYQISKPDDYGEIVLVDSQNGNWRVKDPIIKDLSVGDALRVELEIRGRDVVGCAIMEKLNECFDEKTNLEALMRIDRNKKGRRVLFDSDGNEWQLRLPRWAVVGSLVIVDLVIKNKKVIKWYPVRNLGYVDSPTLSP